MHVADPANVIDAELSDHVCKSFIEHRNFSAFEGHIDRPAA